MVFFGAIEQLRFLTCTAIYIGQYSHLLDQQQLSDWPVKKY